MSSYVEDLKSFLDTSPTPFHAVKQIGYRLSMQDFEPLEETQTWKLEKNSKYFVSREGSLATFCLPKQPPSRLLLLTAHTDSPALKVKPRPDKTEKNMSFLEVETYGSPILHSWLNRDLALAGPVFFLNKKKEIQKEILFLDQVPLIIPELPIHLHREVNETGPFVNAQEHMMPLTHLKTPSSLESLLKKFISFETLFSFDLFLVPLERAKTVGIESEMLSSYRIDNLVGVHAAISALTTYQDSSTLPLAVFWNHEEVGSKSWEGAMSFFLEDLLLRLRLFYQLDEEQWLILKNNSLCLSIDMAHATHPLHMQKYDSNHPVLLGKGIAFKSHAGLKYASSASTLAKGIQIAKTANLSFQHYLSRSDMPCGSTVGPMVASQVGIPTLDLGCPQLSMHSIREVIALSDYLDLIAFLTQALHS